MSDDQQLSFSPIRNKHKGFKLLDPEFYEQFNGALLRMLWHDSPEEYADFLSNPVVKHSYQDGKNDDWAGLSYKPALEKLRFGDDSRAILAEKIFQDVIESDIVTIGRPEILPSLVGSIPNVPAVIAGMPNNMLVRATSDAYSASAPIRIFIDTGISAGVEVPQLIKRGVAALAFTLVMKKIRPIELYSLIAYLPVPFSNGMNSAYNSKYTAAINLVRIETNPIDLARSTWMLTDPAYARRLAFPTSVYILNDIMKLPPDAYTSILWGFDSYPMSEHYIAQIRDALDLKPQDIFIKGGALDDKLMLDNPVAWINKMVMENKALSEQHMESIYVST